MAKLPPIKELRSRLTEQFGLKPEDLVDRSKKELAAILVELEGEDPVVEQTLDVSEPILDGLIEQDESFVAAADDIPQIGDEKWHEYLMTQFRADELRDGHPTIDGLRRLLEIYVGSIYSREITNIFPPCEANQYTSTVAVRLQINAIDETIITDEDIAEGGPRNTLEETFARHPSAMAMTRAEARILRRQLKLKTISAEENSGGDSIITQSKDGLINSTQIAAISMLCNRLDLKVEDFINSGENKYPDLKSVPKDKAILMIENLNQRQQNKV
jgi:hypothetical protein